MMDRIEIRDLHLRTIVGINESERKDRQDVLVNLSYEADLRKAARSDRIEDAPNYRTVAKRVIELVETSSFHLVEALAEAIADAVLDQAGIFSVMVNVQKPGALRFARSVGVTIERRRAVHRAYFVLGSNLEPEARLPEAIAALDASCPVVAVSAAWQSRATGPRGEALDQPEYLNAAVVVETTLAATDLCEIARRIEDTLGRVRGADRYAPRPIDIDLVLYDAHVLVVDRGGRPRRIPDPDVLVRPFVATPLSQVAPDYRHPEDGHTLAEIAARLGTSGLVRRDDVRLWAGVR